MDEGRSRTFLKYSVHHSRIISLLVISVFTASRRRGDDPENLNHGLLLVHPKSSLYHAVSIAFDLVSVVAQPRVQHLLAEFLLYSSADDVKHLSLRWTLGR